jgi:hypothetical protein
MEDIKMKKQKNLENRLERFPKLRARMEQILGIAENENGGLVRADDVEDRVAEEIQKLALEVIEGWAEQENEKQAQILKKDERLYKHGKKNSTGIRSTELSG